MSTPQSLKIWITRAQPGADATAARVRALGHTPFVAPLLAVRMVEDPLIELAGVRALAFTSANGVRAFALACPDRSLQVFAVGAATAQAAREVGFRRVLSADGDVAALAEGIAARRGEIGGAVLHPGAAELAGDLAGALERAGVEVRALTLYDTAPTALEPTQIAALSEADVALVHSARGARALADVLAAHPQPRLKVLGLSKAVLAPLAETPLAALASAPFPLEAALLNLIDRST
ncbi:MAG: uroporphyrinogen-III synthase [Phenylobacterium sp.]|uniref:uroporphyrinogen-III synthase n=1 Tax=Phenylobacterium sp. TaxID=1871053 RepID=UPI0025E0EF4D|nr:uroporphyrinogen-III synthase [Phenylobacterium sp.]MBA4012977.1 uroporphyrinogen-III synthase [Phenylobacterium sp.]